MKPFIFLALLVIVAFAGCSGGGGCPGGNCGYRGAIKIDPPSPRPEYRGECSPIIRGYR